MLKKFLFSFLVIITFQSSIIAQEAKHDTIAGTKGKLDVAPETRKEKQQEKRLYSFSQFGRESLLFIKQPLRWKGKEWLTVGGLAAGTALLTLADQPLRNATQGDQHYYYSVPVVAGRVYGEWYSIIGVAGSFGAYGMIAHDTSAKKIAIELFQAGLYAEVVTGILKTVVGRARPYMNEGPSSFHPFAFFNEDYNSFPSGHSTSAFALSTVLSRHAHSTALKIIAYTPAALTLFSRIYQDKHWVSDELLGAAIGYFVGNWVVDLHEAKRHKINVAVTSIYPPAVTVDLDSFFPNRNAVIAAASRK
jgi:membrane-associated phospholipid phosphatase